MERLVKIIKQIIGHFRKKKRMQEAHLKIQALLGWHEEKIRKGESKAIEF